MHLQSWTKYMTKVLNYWPTSMLFAQTDMFLRKDLSENSNINVGGGKSVLKILYKGDIGQYLEK